MNSTLLTLRRRRGMITINAPWRANARVVGLPLSTGPALSGPALWRAVLRDGGRLEPLGLDGALLVSADALWREVLDATAWVQLREAVYAAWGDDATPHEAAAVLGVDAELTTAALADADVRASGPLLQRRQALAVSLRQIVAQMQEV